MVYVTFLFPTLPYPFLTYSSSNQKQTDKCDYGAVAELPTASPETGLQQAIAAISSITTTACMGSFKLAVYNVVATWNHSTATPAAQPTASMKHGGNRTYAQDAK